MRPRRWRRWIRFTVKVALARFKLYDELMPRLDDSSGLYRAEHHFRDQRPVRLEHRKPAHIGVVLQAVFIFHDEPGRNRDEPGRNRGRRSRCPASPHRGLGRGAVGRPVGGRARSVILSDRPVLMHLNEKRLLHRGGGPAAEYRDVARVWA